MDLTAEDIRQFKEAINDFTYAMRGLSRSAVDVSGDMERVSNQNRRVERETRELADQIGQDADMLEADAKAKVAASERARRAEYERDRAYESSVSAVKSFTTALLDSQVSFSKYNQTLGHSGDAVLGFALASGKAGNILLAGVGKLATSLMAAAFKQTDYALKASDSIAKLGAVNSFSTDKLLDMAHAAGLTASTFEKLVKPLENMRGGLFALGSTSSEAIDKFAKMTASVTKGERQRLLRMGIDDTERMQLQADFISFMKQTGGDLGSLGKTTDGLKNASIEYMKTVYELAELQGISVEEAKKKMEVERATYEWQMQQYKWRRDIEIAEKKAAEAKTSEERQKYEAEAARIKNEEAQMTKLVQDAGKVGDPKLLAAVQQRIVTGAVTSVSSVVEMMGLDLNKYISDIRKGKEYTEGTFTENVKERAEIQFDRFGFVSTLVEDSRGVLGTTKELLNFVLSRKDKDEVEAAKSFSTRIMELFTGDEEGGPKGEAGEDNAQQARATLVETERAVQVGLDKLLQTVNPLVGEFGLLKGVVLAATAATVLYTAAMSAAALKNIGGGLLGKVRGSLPTGLSLGGGMLSRAVPGLLKGAGLGMAGVGLEMGGEALKEKGWEKTGKTVSTLGTAATWAGTGAMIGSVIPGLGTAAGAAIGGLGGAAYGAYKNWGNDDDEETTTVPAKDKGGPIGAGEVAIVGEKGPELVSGPSMVTGREQTKDIMKEAMKEAGSKQFQDLRDFMATSPLLPQKMNQQFLEGKEEELNLLYGINETLLFANKELKTFSEYIKDYNEEVEDQYFYGDTDADKPADRRNRNTSDKKSGPSLYDSIRNFFGFDAEGDTTGKAGSRPGPPIPSNRGARSRYADVTPLPPGVTGLLEQISRGEGTSDAQAKAKGYASGYDVPLGYGAFGGTPDKPISQMTLAELKKYQRQIKGDPRNKFNSSAAGKYQITLTTLMDLQREMGLSNDTVFDKKTQDAMAKQLLQRRGASEFLSGNLNARDFQQNLSKEWASLASVSGRSYYGQHTGVSTDQIQAAIAGLTTPETVATATTSATVEAIKPEEKPTTTPTSVNTPPTVTTTTLPTESTRVSMANSQMMDLLSTKLDSMISKLDENNNIQNRIMRQTA